MCYECGRYPCHPRCPNADDTPVCECDICGGYIYKGEVMYVIDGKDICESCIEEGKTYLELEDDEG